MNIDEFIEQDILIFLDERLEKPRKETASRKEMPSVSFISRDYEKELTAALDRQDLVQAKKTMHDLKQKYDETANGTPEKQQYKFLLTTLYDRFKGHLAEQQQMDQMMQTVDTGKIAAPQPVQTVKVPVKKEVVATEEKITEEGFEKKTGEDAAASETPPPATAPALETAMKATIPEAQDEEKIKHDEEMRAREEKARQEIVERKQREEQQMREEAKRTETEQHTFSDARHALERSRQHIAEGNLAAAMHAYKQAKHFAQHTSVEPQLREEFLRTYAAITQRLKEEGSPQPAAQQTAPQAETGRQQAPRAPSPGLPPAAQPLRTTPKQSMLDRQLLLQLQQEKQQLDRILHEQDFARAMTAYKRMRTITQHLSDEETKRSAMRKLVRIYAIIRELSEHRLQPSPMQQSERRLAATPP